MNPLRENGIRVGLAGLVALLASAGCTFYTDSVNSEPQAQIHKETTGPHYLGDYVTFSAERSEDPDGERAELVALWRAFACTDAAATDCPLENELKVEDGNIFDDFGLTIRDKAPAILVTLRVHDRRGAFTDDYVVLEVANREPELSLQVQGYQVGGGFPLGTYVQIFATGSDADEDTLTYDWTLYPPDGSVAEDVRWDKLGGVEVYELEPDVDGLWTVEVTATDGDGGEVTEQIPILINEDAPPCIAATDPHAVVDGTYVIDVDEEPRRFAVLSVTDDLDFYPAPVGAEFLGAATFTWFIATPDTDGELVAATGHEVADYFVDPAGYAPGDQISLRVEIADRVERTIPCDDAQATCSINGDESCLQRVTWEVEIR